MKTRKIISFLLTLAIVISLGCTTYASSISESKNLTDFESTFDWFPDIKKMNDHSEIKLINKEVKISEDFSITFDAVFIDKYSTLIFYTVNNSKAQGDNLEDATEYVVAKNLKGIDKYYNEQVRSQISDEVSKGVIKNAIILYGKPKENDTMLNLSIKLKEYETKHVDLPIDKANIIKNDLEKEIKDEVKIENKKIKLDKIYLSPIMCYMFVECEGENQQFYLPSINGFQLFADGQSVRGSMKKYDDNDNYDEMQKFYIQFLPIPFETKELTIKYKDYEKELVTSEDFKKLEFNIESDKYIVNKYVEKKIDPVKFSIKDKIGHTVVGNNHKVGLLSSKCNLNFCINAKKGDTINIDYTLVYKKGAVSINLLDSNKKIISTIDTNSKGIVTIEAKESGSYYIEVKTLENTDFYLDIKW